MDVREIVGWNLRRLRVSRGFSQETLGLMAECEPSYVGRVERGRENTTIAMVQRFAGVLSVEVEEFFKRPAAGAEFPKALRSGRKPKA